MLLLYIVTLTLLVPQVVPAPTIAPVTSPTSGSGDNEGGDLETSETGHFRRKHIWRKLMKQLSGLGGYGLGGYGLGGYGLGGLGLGGGIDLLLTGLGQYNKYHSHGHHHHGGYGGGGHGGIHPAGHYGGSHYGPNVGAYYGGYAPSHNYASNYSYGYGFPVEPALHQVHSDLGLWGPSLGIHNIYGWGANQGPDFGDLWI